MNKFIQYTKDSWKIFQDNWVSFLIICLFQFILSSICFVPLALVSSKLNINMTSNISTDEAFILSIMRNPLFIYTFTICGVLVLAIFTFCIIASIEVANGEKSWKKAFQKSWHLFSNAFLLTVLCILLINIGFILFIAPGVFALFLLSLVYPITAIKKSKPIKTIQQSCHLNITHWKETLIPFIIFWVIFAVVFIISLYIQTSILNILIILVFFPIFYTVLFKDISSRPVILNNNSEPTNTNEEK